MDRKLDTAFDKSHDLLDSRFILGMRVDATSYSGATQQVLSWAQKAETRYVCVATVHMVMEAYHNPEYKAIVNSADLVTPDGMPLVWVLRRLGIKRQQRVYGPDLTLSLCNSAAKYEIPVGFYGGRPETLQTLVCRLKTRFPKLNVVYAYSPPFHPLSQQEDEQVVSEINASQTKILFVGLGCPKQEWWMAQHKDKIKAVMVGVGAAFDFHSGRVSQAPAWMQNAGLEWLFRLFMEPKRLWKRYLKHNPHFIWLISLQLLGLKRF